METETNIPTQESTSTSEKSSEALSELISPAPTSDRAKRFWSYISTSLTGQNKLSRSNLKTYLSGLMLFLIPLAVLLLTQSQPKKFGKNDADKIIEVKKSFPKTDIMAKAAYVWDVEGQREIYAKNEKDQLPLSSLTKIMTALVATDEGKGLAKIKITPDSIKQEGDSGLTNEEKWKLKDLIDFSLITSSNDGIYAVASAIESQKLGSTTANITGTIDSLENISDTENTRKNFIELMNKKAKDISLDRTFYLNETGLDSSENINGGYGSAEDMTKLFTYIIKNKPEMIEATAYEEIDLKSLDNMNHKAQNTNEIVGMIPSLIASKTGYTDVSGGNLVVAFDLGLMRPIVISILGSTREGRFEDMKKLIKATQDYLASESAEN